MERYLYFDSMKDIIDYLYDNKSSIIGEGSEGTAYLTKDNNVIKMLDGFARPVIKEENKDDIIMKQDYKVKTFCLPKQLLIAKGEVQGYITDYFPGNVINYSERFNSSISDINIDNLLKAREEMINDTVILTNNEIVLRDLTFNLLYDNKSLCAVDTFGYYYDPYITLEENVSLIDYALLLELHFHDIKFDPDYDKSLIYNLERVRKK